MRTTLDIESDVLQAAKETAEHEGTTAGKVISTWARLGFANRNGIRKRKLKFRNGVPQFPSRGEIITMEHIQKIMDEEGI
ncbi:MAG: hypothetical protein ACKVQJ_01610 [Pyrinomonadaceae bacterium]